MENICIDLEDAILLEKTLALLVRYGKIHTIVGVIDRDVAHEESIKNAETFLNEILRPKMHKLQLF